MTTAATLPPLTKAPRATTHPLTLTLRAPLHHGAFGADTGNAVLHRRVPLASLPSHPGVPAVSGNALRGVLRRLVMRDLFLRCGIDRLTPDLSTAAWDRLYAALANGGHITEAQVTTDPTRLRDLKAALPPLAVFGCALYRSLVPGGISIGWLWPVCHETVAAGLCPGPAAHEAEALLTEITLVRHVDREDQDPTQSGVTPMPVTVEALIPGTVLRGTLVEQKALTPVEWGVLAYGLGLLVSLGGKSGAGFGRVDVAHEIDPAPYDAWLSDPAAIAQARTALLDIARVECA